MEKQQQWEALTEACRACRKCQLCEQRTNVVVGVGSLTAKIMLVGEGPGANEDLQGEPFVGLAGQLLDRYLYAIDLDRKKNVYIANIVKCRPPMNRDPREEEQAACADWLKQQIALLQPKIIVCLGRIAAGYLMNPNIRITKEHGDLIFKDGIWWMATFHPAALLRNPAQKAEALQDFQQLRAFLQKENLY